MNKRIIIIFITLFFLNLININNTFATSQNLVISQVQLGDSSSASNELIEIYNNSPQDVNITGLCIYYSSASNPDIGSKLGCFTPESNNANFFLPSFSYAVAVSSKFKESFPDFSNDLIFSATLSGTSGHIRLIDANKNIIDKLGWGVNSVSPEGLVPATVPPLGSLLSRKVMDDFYLIDTDINGEDFEISPPRDIYHNGNIYEVIDACGNISGFQTNIPSGYYLISEGICLIDFDTLNITELMPNPKGADEGNEYIEIYNPNSNTVDLSNYILRVGLDGKDYSFPEGSSINPNEYLAFYNIDIKFTLLNTSSEVKLITIDGQIVDETPTYSSPGEGMSWSYVSDLWQYTNQPTPNEINLVSLIKASEYGVSTDNNLVPCEPDQYRSPETNRCRKIETLTSNLVPCKEGQYRSEETNRCRNIISDINSLMPCDEGKERNPQTNRCRSIQVLGDNTLTPCKEGQERNPETNRCRNIKQPMPEVGFAAEKTVDSSNNIPLLITVSIICIFAIAYGIWEWRWEIARLFKKLGLFIKTKK